MNHFRYKKPQVKRPVTSINEVTSHGSVTVSVDQKTVLKRLRDTAKKFNVQIVSTSFESKSFATTLFWSVKGDSKNVSPFVLEWNKVANRI